MKLQQSVHITKRQKPLPDETYSYEKQGMGIPMALLLGPGEKKMHRKREGEFLQLSIMSHT